MEVFKIKKSGSKHIACVDDLYFLDGKERKVTDISKKYVYLDQGYYFPRRLFNKWVKFDHLITNAREQSVANKKSLDKIYDRPVNALRYIILYNQMTGNYAWSFAIKYTSHSNLEEVFQSSYGKDWSACSGGFYCYREANAIDYETEENEVLELFGKSDSYGLKQDVYDEALIALKKYHRSVIDDSWVQAYFKRVYGKV